jgi:hypothetical protein
MIAQSKENFTNGIVFVIKAQIVFQIEFGALERVVAIFDVSIYRWEPVIASNTCLEALGRQGSGHYGQSN